MKYLLDTDTCIRYINGRSPKIRAKLPHIPRADVGVSIILKLSCFMVLQKAKPLNAPDKSNLNFCKLFKRHFLMRLRRLRTEIFGHIWTGKARLSAATTYSSQQQP